MKINIGSGFSRFEGFINIDHDASCNPDYIVNLDTLDIKLPFEDNSVDEIKAHHILEHIGQGFIPLMKELYRVAVHGCILDIEAPNETHSVYWGDPTHVRPINVNVMTMFSKRHGRERISSGGTYNNIGMQQDIDFDLVEYYFQYDSFYEGMLKDYFQRKQKGLTSKEEDFGIERLLREANNVAQNNIIKMKAIKTS